MLHVCHWQGIASKLCCSIHGLDSVQSEAEPVAVEVDIWARGQGADYALVIFDDEMRRRVCRPEVDPSLWFFGEIWD